MLHWSFRKNLIFLIKFIDRIIKTVLLDLSWLFFIS